MTNPKKLVLCAMLASVLAAANVVAKTWFLPDYQEQNRGSGSRSESSSGGADLNKPNPCTSYGSDWVTSYDSSMLTCKANRVTPDLTCYSDCRCRNPVTVGAGERCTRWCQGSTCIAKECLDNVPVGAGEQCTQRCASNNNICTAKGCMSTVTPGTGEECKTTCGGKCVVKGCKDAVSLSTGEQCTQRCASSNSVCTAKGCMKAVTPGVGEECKTHCASDNSICTVKGCKDAVTIGTGERCIQKCASNNNVCTAKDCKPTASVNTGERCTEHCAKDNSCTAKGCKNQVDVGANGFCSERCASNTNICTAGENCPSGTQVKNGTCVDDTCPENYQKSTCASSQVHTGTKYTAYGSACYACVSKAQKCLDEGFKKITDFPKPNYNTVITDSSGNPLVVTWRYLREGWNELFGIGTAHAKSMTTGRCGSPGPSGAILSCAECYKCVNGACVYDESFCQIRCLVGQHWDANLKKCVADEIYIKPDVPTLSKLCDAGYEEASTRVCVTEGYNDLGTTIAVDRFLFKKTATCSYDSSYIKGSYILASDYCASLGYTHIPDITPPTAPALNMTHYDLSITDRCTFHNDYVKYSWSERQMTNEQKCKAEGYTAELCLLSQTMYTCPYDSKWKKCRSSGSSTSPEIGFCNGSNVEIYCNGRTYCCPREHATCDYATGNNGGMIACFTSAKDPGIQILDPLR